MTREEARVVLAFMEDKTKNEDEQDALLMAIDALSVDGELIRRADAIVAVSEAVAYGEGFIDVLKATEKLPSADATCATCADRALCIMSAPDGNWKACKDYRPSAEAVQGWIPCSERLPKTGDSILVTFSDEEVGIVWSARPKAWEKYEKANNLIFPVAWMPLPDPWNGGEEE